MGAGNVEQNKQLESLAESKGKASPGFYQTLVDFVMGKSKTDPGSADKFAVPGLNRPKDWQPPAPEPSIWQTLADFVGKVPSALGLTPGTVPAKAPPDYSLPPGFETEAMKKAKKMGLDK